MEMKCYTVEEPYGWEFLLELSYSILSNNFLQILSNMLKSHLLTPYPLPGI